METKRKTVKLMPDTGGTNYTAFVFGATGSGKTTLIANLIIEKPRFIIFDTRDEYDEKFFEAIVCRSLEEFESALNADKRRIIFKFSAEMDQEETLNECLLILHEFQLSNGDKKWLPPVTVAIDELNKFVDGQSSGDGIIEIIQRGRGPKIEKVFGAQWFGTIPTWVRDSFSVLYVFRHTDKSGLARLSDYGFEPELVKNLPRYHCATDETGEIEVLRLMPSNTQDNENKQTVDGNES